jgi:hypothetical protein
MPKCVHCNEPVEYDVTTKEWVEIYPQVLPAICIEGSGDDPNHQVAPMSLDTNDPAAVEAWLDA